MGSAADGVKPPLSGVRVLEIGGYVTAPFATALLAQLGAEVIKIEQPSGGDPFRHWTEGGAESPTFIGINHNKQSVAVDIADPDGRQVVEQLVRSGDVLIENLRPGVLEKRGLGFDRLSEINPELVMCSISGFGDTGPYRDRPGYDTLGQAMAGLLGLLTDFEHPRPMGTSLSDHITGVFAAFGAVVGLHQRNTTGRGCVVSTSLLEATVALLAESSGRYLATGKVPTQEHRAGLAQVYCFVAEDGKSFVLHLSSPAKFWEALTDAIDRDDLRSDPRFRDIAQRRANYDELAQELGAVFAAGPRARWLELLSSRDVPAAPLNSLDEVVADPQVRHLGMVVAHLDRPGGHIATPLRIDGQRLRPAEAPPDLGAHTRRFVTELDVSEDEWTGLVQRGVVKDRDL